jgi:hypothetical protein
MINFQKNSATLFSIAAISAILFFLSACLATAEREPYPFRERDRRTGELRKIEGLWFLAAAEVTGKLEFYRDRNTLSGRVWFDAYQQSELLTDIFFDPRTGELQFTRPNYGQRYVGTLSGDQLVGTFAYEARSLPWEARRH